MSEVCDRFVVVLDANVLYPFRVRDTLLRFAEAGLFRARWTEEILEEWQAALLRNKPALIQSVTDQRAAMRAAFPESSIDGYEELVESLKLPDPNDRHVLAAAIVAGAEHIVTENLRDFPADSVERYGIEAVSADDFLASTFELYQPQAVLVFREMRRHYTNPAMQPAEFVFDIQTRGLPKTAALLRMHVDVL